MKVWLGMVLAASLCMSWTANAAQSTIQEADGMACMGDDKSRKQTKNEAMVTAKRNASEYVSTTVKSQTDVLDFAVQKDLVQAFSESTVRLIRKLSEAWYEEHGMGTCFRIRIQAEVIPNEIVMQKVESQTQDNPLAPLTVKIWTDKASYVAGDKIKIYLKGNKPFYGRVVYRDVAGNLIQLLPNPHRSDHYFEGGSISAVPSGRDTFDLEVSPPFGHEQITVYASTEPTGALAVTHAGSVYIVDTKPQNVGMQTRGISIKKKNDASGKASRPSEFSEHKVLITTRGGS